MTEIEISCSLIEATTEVLIYLASNKKYYGKILKVMLQKSGSIGPFVIVTDDILFEKYDCIISKKISH